MAPLGLHWISEGAVLRTLSGVLFGFGVAVFLWLPLAARKGWADAPKRFAGPAYAVVLVTTLAFVPIFAAQGGAWAAYALAVLAGVGVVCLFALVLGALAALAFTGR